MLLQKSLVSSSKEFGTPREFVKGNVFLSMTVHLFVGRGTDL